MFSTHLLVAILAWRTPLLTSRTSCFSIAIIEMVKMIPAGYETDSNLFVLV